MGPDALDLELVASGGETEFFVVRARGGAGVAPGEGGGGGLDLGDVEAGLDEGSAQAFVAVLGEDGHAADAELGEAGGVVGERLAVEGGDGDEGVVACRFRVRVADAKVEGVGGVVAGIDAGVEGLVGAEDGVAEGMGIKLI